MTEEDRDMCRRRYDPEPCMNYRCAHNLFWEGLKLNLDKIRITDKSLEIGNCSCFINESWTSEEIADIWGLTSKRIKQLEAMAWRKVQKGSPYKQLKKLTFS
jgi:DNA-directed RNA polymerase sigma subunit (sigma70/sigma32)